MIAEIFFIFITSKFRSPKHNTSFSKIFKNYTKVYT
nr:MAG TPA: hypothetical protein [Myoviridae sp. ctTS62]